MKFIYQYPDEEELRKITELKALTEIFNELLIHAGGDVNRALKYLDRLQALGQIGEDIDLDAFREYLINTGQIGKSGAGQDEQGVNGGHASQDGDQSNSFPGRYNLTRSGQFNLREHVFREVFSTLKKQGSGGDHTLPLSGNHGGDLTESKRSYTFGDSFEEVDFLGSFKNNILRSSSFDLNLTEADLEVYERNQATDMALVLLIDISHSMVLYGEDRITVAKKLALALVHLITTRFPKDDLSVVLFGDDAIKVPLSEIHKIDVGPYHTNTQMGLRTAREILLKKKQINKQIIMITDGKPSMIKLSDGRYYKNSFGLDPEIVNRTLDEAMQCRRRNIQMTTFMIAEDATLQEFISKLTKVSKGKAFYSNLNNLGKLVIENFLDNKKKTLRL